MNDLISRQAAIDVNGLDEEIRCGMCKNPMSNDQGCDGNCKYDEILYEKIIQILNKRITPLPSAQPETHNKRTETHGVCLDAISRQAAIDALDEIESEVADGYGYQYEKWRKYFCELPPAQPDIIRCRNCKFASGDSRICMKFDHSPIGELDFCAWAEMRTDESN